MLASARRGVRCAGHHLHHRGAHVAGGVNHRHIGATTGIGGGEDVRTERDDGCTVHFDGLHGLAREDRRGQLGPVDANDVLHDRQATTGGKASGQSLSGTGERETVP